MHAAPIMLLHYLVKHKYQKTNNIYRKAEGPMVLTKYNSLVFSAILYTVFHKKAPFFVFPYSVK